VPRKSKKDAVEEAVEGQAAAKAEKKQINTNYSYQGNEGETKFAPQCQGIINIVKEAGKGGISRVKLLEAMKEIITTRQPIERILTYYQKSLVESGAVECSALADD